MNPRKTGCNARQNCGSKKTVRPSKVLEHFDGHRPLMEPAFGQGTAAAHSDVKAITRSQKWKYDVKDVTEKSQKLMDSI